MNGCQCHVACQDCLSLWYTEQVVGNAVPGVGLECLGCRRRLAAPDEFHPCVALCGLAAPWFARAVLQGAGRRLLNCPAGSWPSVARGSWSAWQGPAGSRTDIRDDAGRPGTNAPVPRGG